MLMVLTGQSQVKQAIKNCHVKCKDLHDRLGGEEVPRFDHAAGKYATPVTIWSLVLTSNTRVVLFFP